MRHILELTLAMFPATSLGSETGLNHDWSMR